MRWIAGPVALAAVLVAAPGAHAQARSYTYVPIGTLGTNYSTSSAGYDVNEAGQVTGSAITNNPGHSRAIRWEDGRITSLGAGLSEGTSGATAINDAGVIVGGTHVDRYQPSHAFVFRDGRRTMLGTGYGSGSFSVPNAINNAGAIVGERTTGSAAPRRGFLWREGAFTDLGTLGGRSSSPYNTETSAEDINDHGQIVGASITAKGYPLHAFLWENGRMRDLGVLGDDTEATQALAINNHGQIVGNSFAHNRQTEPFLWEDGEMTQLESLGEDGSTPTDINDAGDIVGSSKPTESYALHATLWSDGEVYDLNDLVVNLPENVSLGTAEAINESGVIVGRSCLFDCDAGKTALEHGYVLIPEGMPVPTPKPTLVDTSSNARPLKMAGPALTAAKGRWGDGLRFGNGGRLETPAFEIPHKHGLAAWVRPDGDPASRQMIVGQSGVSWLFYDGGQRSYGYSVVDAAGRTVTFTTPPGSADATDFRLVSGGVTKTGQLAISVNGRVYCGAPNVASIARNSVTPITVGAAPDGTEPFRGVIEGALVSPLEAGTAHHRLPWWEYVGSYLLVYFFFDADQRIPDSSEVQIQAPPPAPTDPPCPATSTAPAPSPTPTATPSPTATASPSPSPTPTPTATPSPAPSATPSPTPPAAPVWAPPAPSITAPASYSWSRISTLVVTGTAQPGATVEVFDGARSFGTTTATAAGTWSRTITGLADGAYLLTAQARNLGGASPHSGMRVIQVDATAPAAPAVTAPTGTAATSFTLTGKAEPGTTVEVFENGVSRGTVSAANGSWTKSFTGVPAGTRAFTARATDFAGNTSAASSNHTLRVG